MLSNYRVSGKKPPFWAVLAALGAIILAVFAVLTLEAGDEDVESIYHDWSAGELGITGYRVFPSDSENDQMVVKNNRKFTILLREFRVNGNDLTGGREHIIRPGQGVTLTGRIGSGENSTAFSYSVRAVYDDYDNDIVGYEFAPEIGLSGRFEE